MRALALVLLSLAEASCTPSPPQYPSDAEMIANLNENIGAFEDLIQMFRDVEDLLKRRSVRFLAR